LNGRSVAARWRERLFPPRIELPDAARELVRIVLPTLDLERVDFHLGIPAGVPRQSTGGITLPATLSLRRIRIFIHPHSWDPESVQGLGLILHESFHALQIQEAGPGLGLARPFVILYLACSAGTGFRYPLHPLEIDAYRLAGRWSSAFESAFRHRIGRVEETARLAVRSSGLRFWPLLAESFPGWRRAPAPLRILLSPAVALWLGLWTSAAVLLELSRALLEGAGGLALAILSLRSEGKKQISNTNS